MLTRIKIIISIALLPLALAAAGDAPQVTVPLAGDHRLVINGNGLIILPGETPGESYLRFCDGVLVEGSGFSLTADVVELDVVNSASMDIRSMEFPAPAADPQRIVRDPGQMIVEMAKEMKMPGIRLADSNLKRVGAGGGVVVTVNSIRLETEQLVSTDGGFTWSTDSRSVLTAVDPKTGVGAEISADYLLYDIEGGRLLARGNIISRRIAVGEDPLVIEAQRYELDLEEGNLLASEELRLFSGNYQMCCGRISANLASNQVVITNSPHLYDNTTGRSLDAEVIESDIQGARILARGNVQFKDPISGLSIIADEIAADIEAGVIVASGEPVVYYQGSTLTGKEITVTLVENGGVTVEITGPQHARLDLEKLDRVSTDGEKAEAIK